MPVVDLLADHDADLADRAVVGRADRVLHLHGFEHRRAVSPARTSAPATASSRTTLPGMGASSEPAAAVALRQREPLDLSTRTDEPSVAVDVGRRADPLDLEAPAHTADGGFDVPRR